MGNICERLAGKSETTYNHSIPIAVPVMTYDISNNQNFFQPIAEGKPVLNNTNNNMHPVHIQQPHIIIQPSPIYYNDSYHYSNNMMNGFISGMLLGEILDDDCL